MKDRRNIRIAAGLAACLVAAVAWIAIAVIAEPRHQGRTLDEWLARLDPSIDGAADRETATLAIRRMGTGALPALDRILYLRPRSWTQRLRDLAVRVHLVRPSGMSLSVRQSRAAIAAWILAEDPGVDIAVLVPSLRFHFTNSSFAEVEMTRALVRAGPDGVACLTNLLTTGVARVRDHAGWALAMDERAIQQPGAWDAVIQAAGSDPDPRVRSNLVLYLSKLRGQGDATRLVALGLESLRGEDPNGRWAGAELLGAHWSVPEARAALEGVLQDPDQRVRGTAHRALRASRPPSVSP